MSSEPTSSSKPESFTRFEAMVKKIITAPKEDVERAREELKKPRKQPKKDD